MKRKKPPLPRNPLALACRKRGMKIRQSARLYSRKGRSKDRPFDFNHPCLPFARNCGATGRNMLTIGLEAGAKTGPTTP